jgi:uncharacterized repeat protein (TIGR03803 family)
MPARHGICNDIMRSFAILACAILLSNCSHSFSALPSSPALPNGAFALRPAQGPWLCGQPPSAQHARAAAPALGSGYKSLYKFKAGSDGGYPYGALVALSGKLYGTTDEGGKFGYGTVYELGKTGQERVLYSFGGNTDGAYPCSSLIAVNGKLYGTTQTGGAHGWGTVFEVSTSGSERIVYSFKAGNDGAAPYAGLLYLKGKFYGTTVEGGAKGWGTIFETSASGRERVLYGFKAGTKDGGYPYGDLVSVNGTLYGTTKEGGSAGWGTVFTSSLTGAERVLYNFKAGTKDGGYPFDGLTYLDGKFFGTTKEGGSAGWGTVFVVDVTRQEHVIHSFGDKSDGAYPYARLTAIDGVLYGTTVEGNRANWGTVFRIGPTGDERVLYAFKAGRDGAYPFGQLTYFDGRFYGTTQGGGVNGGWGTAFRIAK